MIGLILGILMFMLLVLAHEFGHFISAKKSGVKVLEFGIGIPPKVCKLRTDKSGTEYTLNLLPLGWFVRLKGEDPKDEEDFNAKDSFIKATMWKKIIILVAGVGANFVLAWALFTIVFTFGTRPISLIPENAMPEWVHSYLMPTKTFLYQQWYISEELKNSIERMPVTVDWVLPDMIWEKIGLQTWDVIESINGEQINAWNIETILKNISWWALDIKYTRKSRSIDGKWACEKDATCVLWIAFSYTGISSSDLTKLNADVIKLPFNQAMLMSLKEVWAQTKLTFSALWSLGKNLVSFDSSRVKWALNKLTGPVGAVQFGWSLLDAWGWKLFLAFAGMISLALAIFNVLPFPALDWGRLLWVLIQGIGKLKPEKYFTIEWYLNLFFFVLLMGLGVYIILKDLVRFRGVHIPFLG